MARPKRSRDQFGTPDADAVIDYMRGKGHVIPNPAGDTATEPSVTAKVSAGRWVAECDECHNGQLVDPDDARFFCIKCFNDTNEQQWRSVIWPEDVDEIEEQLEVLPEKEQHWNPDEYVSGPNPDPPIYGTSGG